MKVDPSVFFLKNLTSINLSNNIIQSVPKQMGQLNLNEIDLSMNLLGEEDNSWEWLKGDSIQSSLLSLNLSNNKV